MTTSSTFDKGVGESLTYAIDWRAEPQDDGPWLVGDETIVTSTWEIPDGLVNEADSTNGSQSVVRLSGGTLGELYACVNTIVTSADDTGQRTIYINVKDR